MEILLILDKEVNISQQTSAFCAAVHLKLPVRSNMNLNDIFIHGKLSSSWSAIAISHSLSSWRYLAWHPLRSPCHNLVLPGKTNCHLPRSSPVDGDMAVTGGNKPASHPRTNHTILPFAQYGEAGRQKTPACIWQGRNTCLFLAEKKYLLVSGREEIPACI